MLWLASLLGMLAVGAVGISESGADDADDTEGDDEAGLLYDDTAKDTDGTPLVMPGPAPEQSNIYALSVFRPPTDDQSFDSLASETENNLEGDPNSILSGTEQDDALTGGTGDDQIGGYGGDDTLMGDSGQDALHGDTGQDQLFGGDGDDILHGEDGADILSGGAGNDDLFGHNDADQLFGDEGDDILHGGTQDDLLDGGAGNDAVHGGLDNDTLIGGEGQDTLFGGDGDDHLSGLTASEANGTSHSDSDFLNGGSGDDVILTGAGDIVTSGEGLDQILLGAWIAQGETAEIMDYVADEDSLVLTWDMTNSADPDIEVTNDPEDPDVSLIIVDGIQMARVHGSGPLSAADIVLIDQSTLAEAAQLIT